MCFNTVKNGKIQLKIGQFAIKYHVFVIVPRQICSYISNKLQLMSATVFTFLRVHHLFFEGKKKMVKHLIIKIRRICFKICLKTSACFYDILHSLYSVLDESKRKKKKQITVFTMF